jgi:hypothetical protein
MGKCSTTELFLQPLLKECGGGGEREREIEREILQLDSTSCFICQVLTPVFLATQEVEIRRIVA